MDLSPSTAIDENPPRATDYRKRLIFRFRTEEEDGVEVLCCDALPGVAKLFLLSPVDLGVAATLAWVELCEEEEYETRRPDLVDPFVDRAPLLRRSIP